MDKAPKNSLTKHPEFWAGLLAPAVAILFLAPGLLVRAAAAFFLWRWYVSPMGLPQLSYSAAFGLSMIVSILLGDRYNPSDDRELGVRWLAALLGPVILLFIGWAMSFVL